MKERDLTEKEVAIDRKKRSFMKRFGQYAAVGAGTSVLIRPTNSSADSSNANPNAGFGQGQGQGGGGGNTNGGG